MLAYPSKHGTFAQCCFNVGPASRTVGQHCNSIGRMSSVCWDTGVEGGRDDWEQIALSFLTANDLRSVMTDRRLWRHRAVLLVTVSASGTFSIPMVHSYRLGLVTWRYQVRIPVGPDICHRGCAYTVLLIVQMQYCLWYCALCSIANPWSHTK